MCTTKKLLAVEQQFGCVTRCDCGTIHLTVGVVSLALDQEALGRIYQLVGAALKQLPTVPDDKAQSSQDATHTGHLQ
jgi:hypothetical protein